MSRLSKLIDTLENCSQCFDSRDRLIPEVYKVYKDNEYVGTFRYKKQLLKVMKTTDWILEEVLQGRYTELKGWRVEIESTDKYKQYHPTLVRTYIQKNNGVVVNEFNTLREAAEKLGLNQNTLRGHVYRGQKKRINGYTFEVREELTW